MKDELGWKIMRVCCIDTKNSYLTDGNDENKKKQKARKTVIK